MGVVSNLRSIKVLLLRVTKLGARNQLQNHYFIQFRNQFTHLQASVVQASIDANPETPEDLLFGSQKAQSSLTFSASAAAEQQ